MVTSMFAKARKRLRRAAKHLEIDRDVLEKLKYNSRVAISLRARPHAPYHSVSPYTSVPHGKLFRSYIDFHISEPQISFYIVLPDIKIGAA